MLNRTLTALPLLAALSVAVNAQPAVGPAPAPLAAPAPSSLDAPPTSDPVAPAPVASAPATAASARPAPAPVSADDPPTSDPAPVASARPAPAFTPAPATGPAAVPAVPGGPATARPSDPPTSAPATASVAPPVSNVAPTTDAAAATPPIPTAASLQTVTKNYPLTPDGNARFLAMFGALPGVVKLPSGVMYRSLVVGKGTVSPVSRMDTATVSYRGWLIDGTSFDNSPPGSPRSFQLNALIPGWRDALLKMKVGDLWEVAVPADQAYGEEGRPPRIAPNQTLIFVISLAKVEYAG